VRRLSNVAVVAAAAGAAAFVVVPLIALATKVSGSALWDGLRSPEFSDALQLSLTCALGAVVLSCALGLPMAWILATKRFPGRELLRAIVLLPMVLPPVVGGLALLYAFGRRGLLGAHLNLHLAFTTTGAVVAATFVAMPLLIVSAEAAFSSLDPRFDEAAASLGASPWYRFRRVTLPTAAPAVGAGAAMCFARALGEFGATTLFAGSLPGRTQTIPLAIYAEIEQGHDSPAIALAVVLVAVSLVVLLSLRGRWRAVA